MGSLVYTGPPVAWSRPGSRPEPRISAHGSDAIDVTLRQFLASLMCVPEFMVFEFPMLSLGTSKRERL